MLLTVILLLRLAVSDTEISDGETGTKNYLVPDVFVCIVKTIFPSV